MNKPHHNVMEQDSTQLPQSEVDHPRHMSEQPLVYCARTMVSPNPSFRIVEIFESLQGEGYNTGMPAIFIRLGRCSLACTWCDTDYLSYSTMTLENIFEVIKGYSARNIIITGGEPSIHPHLEVLLEALKQQGYFLCIESNALHPISPLIDYIAVSPKYCYSSRYEQSILKKADEVRIVVDPLRTGEPEPKQELGSDPEQDFMDWCLWVAQQTHAKHYFLSPLEVAGEMNILQSIALIGRLNEQHRLHPEKYPHWQLSLQTHKFAHIQ